MNAVFLPVNTASGALFASEHWPMAAGFDLLGCAQQEAAAKELYLYPVFDAAFGLQTGGGYGRTAPFPPRRCRAPARCWPI